MDDREVVFAPVTDVDQGVGERGAVVAGEVVLLAENAGGGEDVGRDKFVEEAGELGVGQAYADQGLDFLAEVGFERGAARISVRSVYLRSRSFSRNADSMLRSLTAGDKRWSFCS